jgi:hypothetical protein
MVALVSSIFLLSRAVAPLVGGIRERTRTVIRIAQILSLLEGPVYELSGAPIQADLLELVCLTLQRINPIVIAFGDSIGQVLSLLQAAVSRLGVCPATEVG